MVQPLIAIAGAIMMVLLCHLALTGYAVGVQETTRIILPQDAGWKSDLHHTHVLTITPVATIYLPIVLNTGTPPMPLADVTHWAYQIQDISRPGAVDALVASHYDMLVLEPTRTDWSSDDKYFDTQESDKRWL